MKITSRKKMKETKHLEHKQEKEQHVWYTKTRSLFSVFRVLPEMLSLFHCGDLKIPSNFYVALFVVVVVTIVELVCCLRPVGVTSWTVRSCTPIFSKYTRVADSCWPGVVLLSSPLIGVGLVVALVAQHVGRDVVDLDAGCVVQHFQVLKHRLTDLLQILHTHEHSERVGRLHVRISSVHFTPMKRGMTLLPVGSSGFLSWCWHQGATWSLEQSTQNTLQTNQIRQTGGSNYFCSLSFLFHPQSSVVSRVATLRVATNWLLICCLCINHFSGSLWHPGQQERTKTIQQRY